MEKIKQKISSILSKAESALKIGEDAEYESFLAAAQKLMFKYNLSVKDLDSVNNSDIIESTVGIGEVYTKSKFSAEWEILLVNAISLLNNVKMLLVKDENCLLLIGFKSDVDVTSNYINIYWNALIKLAKTAYNKELNYFLNAYPFNKGLKKKDKIKLIHDKKIIPVSKTEWVKQFLLGCAYTLENISKNIIEHKNKYEEVDESLKALTVINKSVQEYVKENLNTHSEDIDLSTSDYCDAYAKGVTQASKIDLQSKQLK